MIKISTYQITPHLAQGYTLPYGGLNNGAEWLRQAANVVYNRNKGRLAKAGVMTDLFHNHDEKSGETISRYPLIQYQRRNEGYFMVGINEGSHALSELFTGLNETIGIADWFQMGVSPVEELTGETGPADCEHQYTLTDWLPLSRDNYTEYNRKTTLVEKLALLEQILQNQLIKDFSNYLGLGLAPDSAKVKITNVDSFYRSCVQVRVNKHVHDFKPFTIAFSCKLLLPPHICLGNSKVFGFGLLEPTLRPA